MPKFIFLFIPAIFIVLLLASISSKYQLIPKTTPIPVLPTPTSTPITSWKTYENQQYSFEIRYPDNFSQPVTSRLDNGSRIEIKSNDYEEKFINENFGYDTVSGIKLLITVDNNRCSELPRGTVGILTKQVKLNNQYPAVIEYLSNEPADKIRSINISTDTYCISIQTIYSKAYENKWSTLFNQILSTFSFIY
ncbi:MAG: hypothetical protein WCV93_05875 [Candidatus Shapirobacteria bacterium]|jgi:hypothetical protein